MTEHRNRTNNSSGNQRSSGSRGIHGMHAALKPMEGKSAEMGSGADVTTPLANTEKVELNPGLTEHHTTTIIPKQFEAIRAKLVHTTHTAGDAEVQSMPGQTASNADQIPPRAGAPVVSSHAAPWTTTSNPDAEQPLRIPQGVIVRTPRGKDDQGRRTPPRFIAITNKQLHEMRSQMVNGRSAATAVSPQSAEVRHSAWRRTGQHGATDVKEGVGRRIDELLRLKSQLATDIQTNWEGQQQDRSPSVRQGSPIDNKHQPDSSRTSWKHLEQSGRAVPGSSKAPKQGLLSMLLSYDDPLTTNAGGRTLQRDTLGDGRSKQSSQDVKRDTLVQNPESGKPPGNDPRYSGTETFKFKYGHEMRNSRVEIDASFGGLSDTGKNKSVDHSVHEVLNQHMVNEAKRSRGETSRRLHCSNSTAAQHDGFKLVHADTAEVSTIAKANTSEYIHNGIEVKKVVLNESRKAEKSPNTTGSSAPRSSAQMTPGSMVPAHQGKDSQLEVTPACLPRPTLVLSKVSPTATVSKTVHNQGQVRCSVRSTGSFAGPTVYLAFTVPTGVRQKNSRAPRTGPTAPSSQLSHTPVKINGVPITGDTNLDAFNVWKSYVRKAYVDRFGGNSEYHMHSHWVKMSAAEKNPFMHHAKNPRSPIPALSTFNAVPSTSRSLTEKAIPTTTTRKSLGTSNIGTPSMVEARHVDPNASNPVAELIDVKGAPYRCTSLQLANKTPISPTTNRSNTPRKVRKNLSDWLSHPEASLDPHFVQCLLSSSRYDLDNWVAKMSNWQVVPEWLVEFVAEHDDRKRARRVVRDAGVMRRVAMVQRMAEEQSDEVEDDKARKNATPMKTPTGKEKHIHSHFEYSTDDKENCQTKTRISNQTLQINSRSNIIFDSSAPRSSMDSGSSSLPPSDQTAKARIPAQDLGINKSTHVDISMQPAVGNDAKGNTVKFSSPLLSCGTLHGDGAPVNKDGFLTSRRGIIPKDATKNMAQIDVGVYPSCPEVSVSGPHANHPQAVSDNCPRAQSSEKEDDNFLGDLDLINDEDLWNIQCALFPPRQRVPVFIGAKDAESFFQEIEQMQLQEVSANENVNKCERENKCMTSKQHGNEIPSRPQLGGTTHADSQLKDASVVLEKEGTLPRRRSFEPMDRETEEKAAVSKLLEILGESEPSTLADQCEVDQGREDCNQELHSDIIVPSVHQKTYSSADAPQEILKSSWRAPVGYIKKCNEEIQPIVVSAANSSPSPSSIEHDCVDLSLPNVSLTVTMTANSSSLIEDAKEARHAKDCMDTSMSTECKHNDEISLSKAVNDLENSTEVINIKKWHAEIKPIIAMAVNSSSSSSSLEDAILPKPDTDEIASSPASRSAFTCLDSANDNLDDEESSEMNTSQALLHHESEPAMNGVMHRSTRSMLPWLPTDNASSNDTSMTSGNQGPSTSGSEAPIERCHNEKFVEESSRQAVTTKSSSSGEYVTADEADNDERRTPDQETIEQLTGLSDFGGPVSNVEATTEHSAACSYNEKITKNPVASESGRLMIIKDNVTVDDRGGTTKADRTIVQDPHDDDIPLIQSTDVHEKKETIAVSSSDLNQHIVETNDETNIVADALDKSAICSPSSSPSSTSLSSSSPTSQISCGSRKRRMKKFKKRRTKQRVRAKPVSSWEEPDGFLHTDGPEITGSKTCSGLTSSQRRSSRNGSGTSTQIADNKSQQARKDVLDGRNRENVIAGRTAAEGAMNHLECWSERHGEATAEATSAEKDGRVFVGRSKSQTKPTDVISVAGEPPSVERSERSRPCVTTRSKTRREGKRPQKL